jgi:hypothetical protein
VLFQVLFCACFPSLLIVLLAFRALIDCNGSASAARCLVVGPLFLCSCSLLHPADILPPVLLPIRLLLPFYTFTIVANHSVAYLRRCRLQQLFYVFYYQAFVDSLIPS